MAILLGACGDGADSPSDVCGPTRGCPTGYTCGIADMRCHLVPAPDGAAGHDAATVSADAPASGTACGPDGLCPPGLTCTVSDGLCHASIPRMGTLYLPGYDRESNVTVKSISAFAIAETGELSALDTDAVTDGSQRSLAIEAPHNPEAAAATPDGAFLYVSSEDTINAFAIDRATGALAPIDADPGTPGIQGFQHTGRDLFLLVDPAGKRLYVADAQNAIAVYDIAADGGLSPADPPTTATAPGPRGMVFSPDGGLLFVANVEFGSISSFAVDAATGALTNRKDLPLGDGSGGTLQVAAHPTLKVLYVCDGTSSVLTVGYASDGTLTQLGQPSTTGATAQPFAAAVDPSGAHLYVANANLAVISRFPIDPATGALGAVATTPVPPRAPALYGPRTLTMDPRGKILILGGAVTSFAIGADGDLTPVPSAVIGEATTWRLPIVLAQ